MSKIVTLPNVKRIGASINNPAVTKNFLVNNILPDTVANVYGEANTSRFSLQTGKGYPEKVKVGLPASTVNAYILAAANS
jgi:hypothetical protein